VDRTARFPVIHLLLLKNEKDGYKSLLTDRVNCHDKNESSFIRMAVYTASPVSLDMYVVASFLSMTILWWRPSKPVLSLRAVQRADLGSLTRINVDASLHDPQWNYRYPKRAQYPEEHHKYVRLTIEDYLARCDSGVTECIVVSSGFDGACGQTNVIAFSVWDVASSEPDKSTGMP
jgi:hypothetical protein